MAEIAQMRYAVSIFEVAVEQECLEEIRGELMSLNGIFKENPDFIKLLSTPTVSKQEKEQVLTTIFENRLCRYSVNFLCILARDGRINLFPGIVTEFTKLYNQHKNIAEITVITASPIGEPLRNKLIQKLEQLTKKTVVANFETDVSILGGILLKMDNDCVDVSIKKQLNEIREHIASVMA